MPFTLNRAPHGASSVSLTTSWPGSPYRMMIGLPPEIVPASAPPDNLWTLPFTSHRVFRTFNLSAAMYRTR